MTNNKITDTQTSSKHIDFIRAIINEHMATNKYFGKVVTRFPPEPNGFLHIGHAKAICIDFGIAKEYNGACHLRMDDTDPTKEDIMYVKSIMEDIKWLGFDWGDKLFYASDYFEQLYEYALKLIKMGKAYVCNLSDEQIKEYRGTVTEPGKESPYRNRSIEENLDLFKRMKAGEFEDGSMVLRAKIDMNSPNMKMRDPLLYRIRHVEHYRQGKKWCIYPMYDFAHCLSDYIEGITHSLCTLEFENNRELYDWILDELELEPPRPYQYEFARLNLNYTVMSKRKFLELVEKKHVNGWDDPRMPTISGLRRRGYTPESIRNFCDSIGIAKANSVVDMAQLEFCIRDDLNQKAPRVLAVFKPLKVIIDNYPEGQSEMLEASYYPHDVPKEGSRQIPFTKELFIEQDDFMENPPKDYYRLAPGKEVRLRHAYIIKCEEVLKDPQTGEVKELHCTYYPDSKSGSDTSGKKVKGTIQWVSAEYAAAIEVRLYDRLFLVENPDVTPENLNPDSLEIINTSIAEPALINAEPGSRFQFERQGYFYLDPVSTKNDKLVFNRIVTLKDSWAKIVQKETTETLPKPEIKIQHKSRAEEKPPIPEIKDLTPEIEAKINKYQSDFKLSQEESMLIAKDNELSLFFEKAVDSYNNPEGIAKWIVNELLRDLKESSVSNLKFSAKDLADLIELIDNETISGKIAKDIYSEMLQNGGNPKAIADKRGLKQISDQSVLEPIIVRIIKDNPKNVELYKQGRSNLLGFFVGQVLKQTNGMANPKVVNDLLIAELNK